MTERQYLLQHILHLSSMLSKSPQPEKRETIEQALLFYARELQRLDKQNHTEYKQ